MICQTTDNNLTLHALQICGNVINHLINQPVLSTVQALGSQYLATLISYSLQLYDLSHTPAAEFRK